MNCPKCNAELLETVEERWTGEYNNVLGILVFIDCPECGYSTDSTEDEGITLLSQRKKAADLKAGGG